MGLAGPSTFTTLPSAPTGLTTASIGATTVTLSWTVSTGATSYNIQVSVNSNFSSATINQTGFSGTSDPITGLTATTTYYWQVSATNATGTSGEAAGPSFATATAGPTGLSVVSTTPTTATLSWTASGGAVSYNVQVSTSAVFSSPINVVVSSANTSVVVAGLTPNTSYYWQVNASSVQITTWYYGGTDTIGWTGTVSGWSVRSPTTFTTGSPASSELFLMGV